MGRLLLVLLLLAAAVVALGFYLNWFHVSSDRNPDSGRTNVQVEINRDKIQSDADKAKQKVKDAFHRVKEKVEGKSAPGSEGSTRGSIPPPRPPD